MSEPAKKHIMLVDDTVHLLVAVSDFLTSQGFQVTTASNGNEALKALEKIKPDLILLDVMMPGRDGGEVAQEIQGNPRLADIPIVYMTAAVTKQEVLAHGGKMGGQPVIAKPVELDELLARVNEFLGMSQKR